MATTRLRFSRRIVLAFVLMTLVVSGSFSYGIVMVVHYVEQQLISRELAGRLETILHRDVRIGNLPHLEPGTHFYSSGSSGLPEAEAIPIRFAGLPAGMTEIEDESASVYVYAEDRSGVRYMLVQDQQEFEDRETVLFSVVQGGLVLCVLLAWGLGMVMAGRIMEPVSRLAGQVRDLDSAPDHETALADQYADDEIGQLASAFDRTFGRLRRAIRRERLFTSDVSHELRTPLMVISSSCELLLETDLDARQRDRIARMESAARDMAGLVEAFLHLAREEGAGQGIAVNVGDVAGELALSWAPDVRARGVEFDFVEAGAGPVVYDRLLLQTVMTNLLRNALHYTRSGTIRLGVDAAGFWVDDTGEGIADEDLPHIFEPLTRGSRAVGEGSGIGLSLVQRICEHQGWAIRVGRNFPRGSSFRVTIPGRRP